MREFPEEMRARAEAQSEVTCDERVAFMNGAFACLESELVTRLAKAAEALLKNLQEEKAAVEAQQRRIVNLNFELFVEMADAYNAYFEALKAKG